VPWYIVVQGWAAGEVCVMIVVLGALPFGSGKFDGERSRYNPSEYIGTY